MRAFRDAHDLLVGRDTEVFGVSSDSVESHAKFVAEESLPFRLISDPDDEIRSLYGIPNSFFFVPGRVTFVIGKDRIVREVYQSQLDFSGHAEVACDALPPGDPK